MTLQYFDGTGARCEALGMLERVEMAPNGPVLHIRRKDDSMVEVPLSKIRAGKVVPTPRPKA